MKKRTVCAIYGVVFGTALMSLFPVIFKFSFPWDALYALFVFPVFFFAPLYTLLSESTDAYVIGSIVGAFLLPIFYGVLGYVYGKGIDQQKKAPRYGVVGFLFGGFGSMLLLEFTPVFDRQTDVEVIGMMVALFSITTVVGWAIGEQRT